MAAKKTVKTVDAYISSYPNDVQLLLQRMRATIAKAAPKAKEGISYGIPSFRLHRILVWFAAFKNHIGFYPGVSGIATFKKELSVYKHAKGSVQFPFDKPLPLALVGRIVRFRAKEDEARRRPSG